MKQACYSMLVLYALCRPLAGLAAEDEAGEHGRAAKNDVAVFLGATHEGRRDNSAALGLEYERRVNETFGIGALAEFTAGDADFWVYAIPLTLHAERWKFVLAPGIEDNDGHTVRLLRLGAGYEFEAGRKKITPALNVDFVDGETVIVLGVSIGTGF